MNYFLGQVLLSGRFATRSCLKDCYTLVHITLIDVIQSTVDNEKHIELLGLIFVLFIILLEMI